MTSKQLATFLLLICGIMMMTSHLPYAYAADDGGDGGGGGGDSGGDSNDGGGDSGDSNDGDGGKETKQGSSSSSNNEGKDNGEEQTDAEDNAGDKAADDNGEVSQELDREALKGTPEEQEQAAIDDYINEEPGIVKPYPPVEKDKPTVKEPWVKNPVPKHVTDYPIHKPYPGKGEGNWCKSHPGKCGDGVDDDHPKHDWCKWHKCEHHGHGDHDHHHNHDHNYHNDHHYHNHNDNKYYYYYNNDYSDNHATVILQLDYHGSNNHDDIRLEIGNDFDTVINFAGEPEDLVVSNLDIDEGENFDVCMENLDSDKVNCIKTHLEDEDKAVYVDLRVPA